MLDENGLGNGVPFWFVGWDENKLRVSVPVRPAGGTWATHWSLLWHAV